MCLCGMPQLTSGMCVYVNGGMYCHVVFYCDYKMVDVFLEKGLGKNCVVWSNVQKMENKVVLSPNIGVAADQSPHLSDSPFSSVKWI